MSDAKQLFMEVSLSTQKQSFSEVEALNTFRGPQGLRGEPGSIDNLVINGKEAVPVDGKNTINLTPADVGALGKNEKAVDADKLNGKDAVYYLGARNLLDNSDFLDPVNQRGKAYVEGTGYSLDRWYGNSDNTKVSIEQGSGIIVVDSTFVQNIEHKYIGKTLTIAACGADGNVTVSTGTVHDPDGYKWICATDSALYVGILQTNTGELRAHIRNSEYKGRIVWAALYEGSYTADNLPPYVPKGYAVELAKCLGYRRQSFEGSTVPGYSEGAVIVRAANNNYLCSVNFDSPMIGKPTVTIYNPVTKAEGSVVIWSNDEDISGVSVHTSSTGFAVYKSGTFDMNEAYSFHYIATCEL